MLVLWILLGLLALIFGLLCVPVRLRAQYSGTFTARLAWLFFKYSIAPATEKNPKEKKEQSPKKEEKKSDETPKAKKPNAFQRYYNNEGIDGFVGLLQEAVSALKRFGTGLNRSIYIKLFALQIVVTGDDPKTLTEKYGKTCAAVFPLLGWLGSNLRVSRRGAHMIDVHPDYTGWDKKQVQCAATIDVVPLVFIAALIALAVRLGVKVVLAFLRGSKEQKTPPITKTSSQIAS
ncbi:MAG: hypothetical protein LBB67_07540 [Oscillospiraceae bacterium]|jgi:hypothetical protein|nr:hypothetical protein [Oscillospiraceae bacterium]